MSANREAALAESWQRTVAAIPTLIGRIAYHASIRNANTGAYEHFGLAQRIGESEVDRLVRRSHTQVFQEWLCFGLKRQKEELEEYFDGLDGDRREIVANWLVVQPYSAWIPGESRDVERKLFLTDLGVVLEMIRIECGAASRDPDL